MTTSIEASTLAAEFSVLQRSQQELIVADGVCPRIRELLPGALHELVALGLSSNPLAAITAELDRRRLAGRPIQTLHIVAHGRPGAFEIGGCWIDNAALIANAEQLAQWQVETIALWSCEVGADGNFAALLGELSGSQIHHTASIISRDHWELQLQHNGNGTTGKTNPATPPFSAATINAWEHSLPVAPFTYQATFDQVVTASNPSGNNFNNFAAVVGTTFEVYPVDPFDTSSSTTEIFANGSSASVWLVIDGTGPAIELYLTNGAQRSGGDGGPEDKWVLANAANIGSATVIYVLSSGGYTLDPTGETINSSISLVDLDQLVTFQATGDATPPAAPVVVDVTEDITDPNFNDLISNLNQLTAVVAGEPGCAVKVYTTSGILIPVSNYVVTEIIHGQYLISFTTSLLDAAYVVTLTDASGNESAGSNYFIIDTIAPGTPPGITFGALDITTATDTGANDLTTADGTPDLTFTGESGLTITVRDASGASLPAGSYYTVTENPNGAYTVDLLDADLNQPGVQPFGTYDNTGAATGNAANLADGTYRIVATDVAGNTSIVVNFVIDTTRPAAPVVTNVTEAAGDPNTADLISNDNTQFLIVTGEPGATLKVYTPAGVLVPTTDYSVTGNNGTYEINFGNNVLADGDYVVTQTDASGHESGASNTFTIDTTAPAAPVVTNVTEVNGDPNTTDLISNDNTQVLTVTGEPGATLKVYTAAGVLVPTNSYTVTGNNGTYTVDFGINILADGDYVVKQTDASGNESGASNSFTIDTTPPGGLGAIDMVDSTDSSNPTDELTNNGNPALSFNGPAGLTISLVGADGTTQLTPSHYSYSYLGGVYFVSLLDATPGGNADPFGTYQNGIATNNPPSVADGTYTIRASDAAGNTTTVGTFVIDTTPPAAPLITNVTELPSDPNTADLTSNDNTQILTVIGEPGATLKVYTAAGVLVPTNNYAVTGNNGTYEVNFGNNVLADGDYAIKLTDASGNESAASSNTFTIDTTPPSGLGAIDMVDSTDSSDPTDELTNNGNPALSFNGSAGLTISLVGADGTTQLPSGHYSYYYLSGVYFISLLDATLGGNADPFGTYQNGIATNNPPSVADGTYTIRASDAAGNTTTVGTFVIDTTPPAAPVITNVTEAAGDPNTADLISNDNTQILTVTGEPGATLKVYTAAGGVLVPTTNYTVTGNNGTYTVDFGNNVLADGDYVVKLTDASGNESAASSNAFRIDTTPPAAPVITNVTEAAGDPNTADLISNDNTQILTVTGEPGATLKVYTAAGVLVPTNNYTVTGNNSTYEVNFGNNVLADGNYIVKLTDASGNESAASSNAFTIDATPPAAPVVTNVTEAAGDPNTADLISNDNTQILTVTGEPGATLKVYTAAGVLVPTNNYTVNEINGTYTVDFGNNPLADGNYAIKLTDASGNESGGSNSFTIDTTAPGTAAGTPFGTLDITTPTDTGANDNTTANGTPDLTFTGEPGLAVTVTGPSGQLLPVGSYTVTENPNGTYTVDLLDADPNTAGLQPFGSYDNNGNPTGNAANRADGTYTIKAADSAGNSANVGTFIVDTTRPGIAPSAPLSALDMSNTTDSGNPNDNITRNGNPVLNFSGEAGLTVALLGPDGTPLSESNHYTVTFANGSYTVSLTDADPATAGAQTFGDFFNGIATQNPAKTGDGIYTIRVTDQAGNASNVGTFRIATREGQFVTGALAAPGGGPHVKVWNSTGQMTHSFMAYDPRFQGGVDVTLGDVNGDGFNDYVTSAGPGGGPHIKVFSGIDASEIAGFYAFDSSFQGGTNLAVADFNHDGRMDIVVGAGPKGSTQVKVFDGASAIAGQVQELVSFNAYDSAFGGGVSVAAGDIDNNGTVDIVTGAGAGGGPHVKVFAVDIVDGTAQESAGFYAYDSRFGGGVSVALGHATPNDNTLDIITGAGAGGGPHVKVFDGLDVLAGTPTVLQSFFAFDPAFKGGVNVGSADLNGDGTFETLLAGAGASGGPHVKSYELATLTTSHSFFAYDAAFAGGVSVG